MSTKLLTILVGLGAIFGLIYGINRISTQLHPYGNWFIALVVMLVVAVIAAWAWQWYEDDQGKG
jgi:membrane protein implicated in regulation of membrane protease activity